MVSKRIKYARAHLTRRRHIAILAQPLWRRTQRAVDFNCLAQPFSVSRAALRARASKRVKMMARPKTVQRRYESLQSRVSLQYPRTHRESLSAETSKRLFDLALPKKSALIHARRYVEGNRAMLATINSLLRGIRKSRYQKYRIICSALQQRAAAREEKIRRKLRRALAKPGDWERHNRVLERLAAPKRAPKPPRPPRSKKKLFDKTRIAMLALPVQRLASWARDPFRVARSALVYEITETMRQLAVRQHERPEPPYREPGYVPPEALQVVPSKRTVMLAKPAVRPAGRQTNLKEDAFSVPPRALKARCSPRVKVLAQPKRRPRPARA